MSEKAVIYARVSTKKQADAPSLDTQADACLAYAEKMHLRVVETFREVWSGYESDSRPEFNRMLDFIVKEKVGHLIFSMPDRLSRNLDDIFWLKKKCCLTLHDVLRRNSFNLADERDYVRFLDFQAEVLEAEKYSAILGVKVRDGMAKRAAKGDYPGFPPIGYHVNPIGWDPIRRKRITQIIVDREVASFIRQLYELYATGDYTLASITERMRALGFRGTGGRFILKPEIDRFLKNPFYYGSFHWKGTLHKGNHEPIISKALFDEVQEVLAGRKVNIIRGVPFRYKGLLQCSLCGCAVVGEKKKGRYIYYHCTGGRGKCSLPYFREEEIDELFRAAVGELDIEPVYVSWLREEIDEDLKTRDVADVQERASLQKEKQKLIEAKRVTVEGWRRGVIDDETLKEEVDRIGTRLDEINERLILIDSGDRSYFDKALTTLELCKDMKTLYKAVETEEKEETRRKLNNLLFRTVLVHPKDEPVIAGLQPLEFDWNEPFATFFTYRDLLKKDAERLAEDKAIFLRKEIQRAWRDSNSRPAA